MEVQLLEVFRKMHLSGMITLHVTSLGAEMVVPALPGSVPAVALGVTLNTDLPPCKAQGEHLQ